MYSNRCPVCVKVIKKIHDELTNKLYVTGLIIYAIIPAIAKWWDKICQEAMPIFDLVGSAFKVLKILGQV